MREGVTLVIGGMGVKGACSVGALQALQRHNVPVKSIVASGISSIVAAQFSLGWDLEALTDHFSRFFTEHHRYLWGVERLCGVPFGRTRRVRDSFSYFLRERLYCHANFKRLSILEWDAAEDLLANYFGAVKSSDLRIPIAVSAIDLNEGREILLRDEALVDRLKAGIAFPGLFPPVYFADRVLTGSTFYCELPLGGVVLEDSPVVAIDIPSPVASQSPRNIVDTLARMDEIRSAAIKQKLLAKADHVFSLDSLRGYPWGNYKQISQQVQRARDEMERLLGESEWGLSGSLGNVPADQ